MATRHLARLAAQRRNRRAQRAETEPRKTLYSRMLCYERLEERRLLALVTVDTRFDTVDLTDGLTSLREAVFATNLVAGPDIIQFAPSLTASGPVTISLTQGELRITDDLNVDGPGANLLTLDATGSDLTPDENNGDGSRIFQVDDASLGTLRDVFISGLTLTGGDVRGRGGAILSSENLAVLEARLVGNAAIADNTLTLSYGGAIAQLGGNLTVSDTTILNNSGDFGGGIYFEDGGLLLTLVVIAENTGLSGAGIYFAGGTGQIRASVIRDNSAGAFSLGGGIYASGNLRVDSTTISGNSADYGGGIFSRTDSSNMESTLIVNSTISGNTAFSRGGGVRNAYGETRIEFSTITGNAAPPGQGSGVASRGYDTSHTSVWHSIIAGNTRTDVDFATGNINTFDSNGFNLIGTGNAVGAFNTVGDQTGVTNPLLGPLADNGGPPLPGGNKLLTHALLPGSPAINAGDLNVKAGVGGVPLYDQRGEPFRRVVNGRIDIGAFEYQSPSDLNLVVDTLADESDNDHGRGDLSLREAIELANLYPSDDTIRFDPALTAGGPATILLTKGELRISDDVVIDGPGANRLTIDASGNDPTPDIDDRRGSRVINIDDGVSTLIDVSITGVTLTGGDVLNDGGAILSRDNLTVLDSIITENSADRGGGIFNSGNLMVEGTSINDNSAFGDGGGIHASALDLTASVITRNSADRGGGIFSSNSARSVAVNNSIISDNSAEWGAGVFSESRTLTLTACTVIHNVAEFSGGGIFTTRSVTVVKSTIRQNSAATSTGGGIDARTGVIVIESDISHNSASLGGGGIWILDGDVTLTDSAMIGNSTGGSGGAILAMRTVVLANSTVSGNSAGGSGGAIDALRVTVSNSTIRDNSADGRGGGISASSSLTATNSTISGNSTNTAGGGILGGIVTVTNSTVSGNSATSGMGGGIWMSRGTITNSTISGNSSILGGGIYSNSGSSRVDHSTIAFNTATIGGGAFIASGTLVINHTILATNTAVNGDGFDVHGLIGASATARYSFIGVGGTLFDPAPIGSPDANGNLVGGRPGDGARIDPRLAPLADNRGPTKTHALFADSPAIDAGDPMAVAGVGGVPEFDQRGPEYSRVFGSRIDMGALERQNVGSAMQLVVDTLVDEVDGDYSPDNLSLREAVALANGNAGLADTIAFDPTLAGGRILLVHGELVITESLTITGLGVDRLTIDASGSDPTPDENNGDGSRIFRFDSGSSPVGIDLAISGLRLTGGDAFQGGAIRGAGSNSNLTVSECTISDNSSAGDGGGVFAQFGNVAIADSTISGNSAARDGGGIHNDGDATISNSMIIGNSAVYGRGGGLSGPATITGSTITDNLAAGGGGIWSSSFGDVAVIASSINGNTAHESGGGILVGGFGSLTITESTISGNAAGSHGGGIDGNATVVRSTINGNMAGGSGGGLRIDGRGLITDSLIAHNSAVADGGGIHAAIFFSSDLLSISNSTISQNIAGNNGGGIYLSVSGLAPSSTIAFSTISKNVAGTAGGGIWEQTLSLAGTPTVANSIVADNSAQSGDSPDVRRLKLNFRYSLIGNGIGSGLAEAPIGMPSSSGNLVGGPMHGTIDPLLGPLAANGGPTMTHALLPGSPAINAGDPAAMAGVSGVPQFDQRGEQFARVYGGRIDIGAFEAQPNPLAGDYNFNGVVDAADVVVWRKTVNSTTDMRADGNGDGVVNQDDWQVWRANFGRTAASIGQGARSTESEANQAPPQRPAWQPPASPGVSVATSRSAFRPPPQRFVSDDELLASLAPPRASNHARNDFVPARRLSMRDASADSADANVDAVDSVFETLGAS